VNAIELESRPAQLTPGTAAWDVAQLDLSNLQPSGVEVALQHAGQPGSATQKLRDLAALLSPEATPRLEELAERAHDITVKRFGRTVRLFAPLYLSNECVSVCTYCGFSATNDIARRTLDVDEVVTEAEALLAEGFRHILLVAGEHARIVSKDYLVACAAALAPRVPTLSIEVQVWDSAFYGRLVDAGCDGLVVYQETYNRETYAATHLKGKKRNYEWRLAAPDRGAAAGMRRLGIGALLGLHHDWREEAMAVAAHALALTKRWWRAEVSIALPRLRPAAGGYVPANPVADRDFVQLICALRLVLPDVGISMSTRETAALRDHLVPLGVTTMSAGSRTAPGAYAQPSDAEAQFEISDERTPAVVASSLRAAGYDPVWKDWQRA
jgi:2-iminoacetate synthase